MFPRATLEIMPRALATICFVTLDFMLDFMHGFFRTGKPLIRIFIVGKLIKSFGYRSAAISIC